MYGKELILDLHHCDNATMEIDIQSFCEELAELINMQCEDFHEWRSTPDEVKDANTYGISVIQFIITSNITIHVLPILKAVYINLFSCKDFDEHIARKFIETYFESEDSYMTVVGRR